MISRYTLKKPYRFKTYTFSNVLFKKGNTSLQDFLEYDLKWKTFNKAI